MSCVFTIGCVEQFIILFFSASFCLHEGYCVFPQHFLIFIKQTKCFWSFLRGHIFKTSDHFLSLCSGLSPNALHIFWSATYRFGRRCSSWGLVSVERPLCISCTWHCCLCSLGWHLSIAVVWHGWLLLFILQSLIVAQPVVPHPAFKWPVFILG